MLMTALYTVLAGGFIAIAALGHVLVFNALVFGKPEPQSAAQAASRSMDRASAAS
jgi:hypothetical protein